MEAIAWILGGVCIGTFLYALYCFFKAIYHFYIVIRELKPEAYSIGNSILGPFLLLKKDLLSDKGNKHKRFIGKCIFKRRAFYSTNNSIACFYRNNALIGILLLQGVLFWLVVLDIFPFNQKGFDAIGPYVNRYNKILRVLASIQILYAGLLFFEVLQ